MSEKTAVDPIGEEVLGYEVSDEAVEAAGMRTEIAGAWTFVCTGIQCDSVPNVEQGRSKRLAHAAKGRCCRPDSAARFEAPWDSPYRAGRADCWIKVKNPNAPAVTREAEEEWN
jgi:hypothetical protein